jgi:SepF-like predicted cell division protein (DUF552 family)
MAFFSKIKEKFTKTNHKFDDLESEEGYVELDTDREISQKKFVVRPFLLKDFDDVKQILDSIRAGATVALINIKPLKERDLLELKRAISKMKKTADAIEGEIAGFGDDYIVITPRFATIYRSKQIKEVKGE